MDLQYFFLVKLQKNNETEKSIEMFMIFILKSPVSSTDMVDKVTIFVLFYY